MKTYTGKDAVLTIQPYKRVNHQIVGVDSLDRTLIGKDDPLITVEGFTLVNLLGSYGGFEKDSNGDGVADGWYSWTTEGNRSIVAGIQGNAQQQSAVYSGAGAIGMHMNKSLNFDPTHKYFLSYWVNPNVLGGDCGVLQYYNSANIPIKLVPAKTGWQKLYSSFQVQSNYTSLTLYVYAAAGAVSGTTYTAVVDNICTYDLTWMDTYSPMPQSLQEKYSVSKWVDMTDDDLAAELPYVDGVAYVGVES